MAEGEDRTHAPSERRLQRARGEGQAPVSREVVMAVGLGAAALVLVMGGPVIMTSLAVRLRDMLVDVGTSPEVALRRAGAAWIGAAGPMLLAVVLAGSFGVLLQTGFLLSGHSLMPDLGRLDPRRGLKRVFGLDNAMEVAKSLAKLGVLAWAVWRSLRQVWPLAPQALLWMPSTLIDRLGREVLHVFLLVLAAQALIAVFDVGWTRWRFSERLRMSREDLRQETTEAEGNPKIKSRLRQLRVARARKRMIAAVGKATVVVTNPTHYAVALSYQRGTQAAPRVVAKGVDEVAARIREAAAKAGVPIFAAPPLARALYGVALDSEVPTEHFRAVAEIIAYVWRLRGLAGVR